MPARAPLSLFYSYAHEDEPLRVQLEIHLSLLRRQGLISEWHNRKIVAGTEWARQIDEHLESASLILLLISPDFLASDYCYDIEMQRALERHEQREACVIPIILRPYDWQDAPFAHLQALPDDGKAVTEWVNQDAAFRDIARGIRSAIEQFSSVSTQLQVVSGASRSSNAVRTRTSTMPTDRNRQRMLKRVHATWIAGVLEQSLHGAALMVLGLEEKTDALDNPWRLLMQEVDRPAQMLPEGTRITQVYNETVGFDKVFGNMLSVIIFGTILGLLIGWLPNGGVACIKHVCLRLLLWYAGCVPFDYPRFLDYAAELILLRKVGGGYIFIHRLLLEYFASLEEEQGSRKVDAEEHTQDVLV